MLFDPALLWAEGSDTPGLPRARLGVFSGPRAQEMRLAVEKALQRYVEWMPDTESAPTLSGRITEREGRFHLRLAVRDADGRVVADETYDLRDARLLRTMPSQMVAAIGRVQAKEVMKPTRFGEQVTLGLGLGLSERAFALVRANKADVAFPAFRGSAPSLSLEVQAFPLAWFDIRNPYLRSIGIQGVYTATPKIESKIQAESGTPIQFPTSFDDWEAGLFYRFEFWKITLAPGLGLGSRSFSIEGDSPPIPAAGYDYKIIGSDLDVPLPIWSGSVGLAASFDALLIDGISGLDAFAKSASASGYAFSVGTRARLPYHLELALFYRKTHVSVTFAGTAPMGPTAKSAEEATTTLGARVSLGY